MGFVWGACEHGLRRGNPDGRSGFVGEPEFDYALSFKLKAFGLAHEGKV